MERVGILGSERSSPGHASAEAVKVVYGGSPGLGWQVAVNDPQAALCSAHLHLLGGEARYSPHIFASYFCHLMSWDLFFQTP